MFSGVLPDGLQRGAKHAGAGGGEQPPAAPRRHRQAHAAQPQLREVQGSQERGGGRQHQGNR